MNRYLLAFLLISVTAAAHGQNCDGKHRFSLNPTTRKASVTFGPDGPPANLTNDAAVTLAIGGRSIPATVKLQTTDFGTTIAELTTAEPIDNTPSAGYSSGDISLKPQTGDAIELCPLTPLNYSMHVGPTVEIGDGTDGNDPAGVMRFQFRKGFVRTVAVRSDPTLIPSMRNLQQELSVSIDTTDQQITGDDAVDDNRLVGAIRSPAFTFGPRLRGVEFFNRVRVGLEGQIARAAHNENRNRDITVVIDGWMPFFQSLNILSSGRTATLPLSFRVSAGHRAQSVDGTKSAGRVAEIGVNYRFYVFDDYAVDLSANTLFNDLSNRPASTPRTQPTYKAQVWYKKDPLSRFSVVASYEHGHSGPVFTDLRQFFLGVGVQQLLGVSSTR